MQRLSILKGNAFVIVYSVTSRQSLEELASILLTLKEIKGEQITTVPIILVGNKIDKLQVLINFYFIINKLLNFHFFLNILL